MQVGRQGVVRDGPLPAPPGPAPRLAQFHGLGRALVAYGVPRCHPAPARSVGCRILSSQWRLRAAAQERVAGAGSCRLQLAVQRQTKFGELVKVVGSTEELGNWDARAAPTMRWTDGHVWVLDLTVPAGTTVEFRFIAINRRGEPREERATRAVGVVSAPVARAFCNFDDPASLRVDATKGGVAVPRALGVGDVAQDGGPAVPEGGPGTKNGATPLPQVMSGAEVAEVASAPPDADVSGQGARQGGGDAGPAEPRATEARRVDDGVREGDGVSREERARVLEERGPAVPGTEVPFAWEGKETVFMQSNEHRREREGVWDSSGLEGAAKALVEGDRDAGSWRKKLEVVARVLVEDAPEGRPATDALAFAAVYLQWVNSGAIACVEDGGHHRPNRHAELGRVIFRSMEWVAGDPSRSPVDLHLARKVAGKLPAFSEAFTCSVPLTRIRDIAHRNDIPSDLKREIKHTIQNKLHRNAGPEDLVATEAMLARIQASRGDFSGAFVAEFETFARELREFFGAGSLGDMLDAIRPSLDDAGGAAVDQFLAAKGRLDGGNAGDDNMQDVMDALHRLTTVRATLVAGLSSGLRNDAPDTALVMRQRWRLAESRLEQFAFVLLSRLLNCLDRLGGAPFLSRSHEKEWALPIGAVVLGLRHVGLGAFEPRECMALEQELATWQQAGQFQDRANALRLRATVERAQRMVERYCDMLLSAYPRRARQLGTALGIPPERASVFAESEIRASVVFQVSKLLQALQKVCRLSSKSDPWEAVVAGTSVGKAVVVEAVTPEVLSGLTEDTVLIAHTADGDEEIAVGAGHVKGIVLLQSLPHLSHLGVRARQEGVPFATCDDAETAATVLACKGKRVGIEVATSAVQFGEGVGGGASAKQGDATAKRGAERGAAGAGAGPAPSKRGGEGSGASWVALEDAKESSCGAKAHGCARLARLAASSKAFRAQPGGVLPYGALESALASAGEGARKAFAAHMAALEAPGASAGDISVACTEIQRLIGALAVPADAVDAVARLAAEGPGGPPRLIFRSSSNVEDLKGVSGAGLYESVGNVDPADRGAVEAAVRAVWASLFTPRAVGSRRAAGIPQSSARMAVLVQPMVDPEVSFVVHTVSPLDRDPRTVLVEAAPGLGETLASGARGSPWRLQIDKATGDTTTLTFANFSNALTVTRPRTAPSGAGGSLYGKSDPLMGKGGYLRLVDYSREPLSVDADARAALGKQLRDVAVALEAELGEAQDVEGCVLQGQVYVLQARPQP